MQKQLNETTSSMVIPKIIPWVAFILCLILAAALLNRFVIGVETNTFQVPQDFSNYLSAVKTANEVKNPYQDQIQHPFRYAPGVLPLFDLLPESEPFRAWRIFGSISIVCFFSVLLFNFYYRKPIHLLALVCGVALSWRGVLECLEHGQIDLILFGIAGGAAGFLRGAPFLSGFLAGVLPWFKLHWLLYPFPLFLMLKRHKKGGRWPAFFTGFFMACLSIGAALPAWTYGSLRSMEWSQIWLEELRTPPPVFFESSQNQSIWFYVLREFSNFSPIFLIGIVCIIFGLILGRLVRRTLKWKEEPEPSSIVAVTPWYLMIHLLSPLSWSWASLFAVGVPHGIRLESRSKKEKVLLALGALGVTAVYFYGPGQTLYWVSLIFLMMI